MTLDEFRATAKRGQGGYHLFPSPYLQMAPTLEDCEFLYALVRVARPQVVLELGTGYGTAARFIAEALLRNGAGYLWTVEQKAEFGAASMPLLDDFLEEQVLLRTAPPLPDKPDLVFVDSGYEYRAADIREWLTNGYRGPVVVHDSERAYPEFALGQGCHLAYSPGLWVGCAA